MPALQGFYTLCSYVEKSRVHLFFQYGTKVLDIIAFFFYWMLGHVLIPETILQPNGEEFTGPPL